MYYWRWYYWALGGYLTVSYCEEFLARFEDYYKKNANKNANSYNEAKNYFILIFCLTIKKRKYIFYCFILL